jgi:hypothetical protein
MSEATFLAALSIFCGSVVVVSSLAFLNRLLERRHERTRAAPREADADRLERIERAVETTALEVERISEASRFMSKLLADRSISAGLTGRVERVITPH